MMKAIKGIVGVIEACAVMFALGASATAGTYAGVKAVDWIGEKISERKEDDTM